MSKAKQILDVIRNRRSVFPQFFNDKKIESSTIELILESANWAPNHRKTEPWRFYVFTEDSKEKLGDFLYEKVLDIYPENKAQKKAGKTKLKCSQSSVVLAIVYHRDEKERVPEWEEIAATSMAVQNMWLTCHALGIGTYWSSPATRLHLQEHINLKERETCLGFMYMGYHDMPEISSPRGAMKDKVTWV